MINLGDLFTRDNGTTTIIGAIIVAVVVAVLGFIFSKRTGIKKMKQKTGDNSTAIQSGRDSNIHSL